MNIPTAKDYKRVEALRTYHILDSLPETDYDELTQLAAQICQTPIALISLVDTERQWFKSNHGLPVRETPRPYSFCAQAITQPDQTLIIADARTHERYAQNPLVVGEPHIVFYAGAPLVDENGMALGSLCVIDRQTRQLTPHQLSALSILAKQVVRLLQLRKQMRDLQRSNHNLQEFAYVASHDLQAPLRKIQSFSSLLSQHLAERLDETSRDYLARITKSGARMSTLINDLLSYSRLGTCQQAFSPISLNAVVGVVLETLSLEMEERQAQVQVDELPVVEGDSSQLNQLLQNLLSNALKFTPPGQAPQVHVAYRLLQISDLPPAIEPHQAATFYHQISVSDQGVGFDMKYVDRIFQVFHRLHGKHEFAGTGVGLAICQRVMENHGGAITASSKPGEGATFRLYLPA